MASNPTIVVAHLDDKEFRQNIANLVATVKRATHTMADDFDSSVGHISSKIKELSSVSVAENEKAEKSVKRSRKNEQAALDDTIEHYDKLVSALRLARKEAASVKPTFAIDNESISRYSSALQKIERLQKEIDASRGEYYMARTLKSQFTPNISDTVKDLTRPSDELLALNRKLAVEERQSARMLKEEYANALKMPQRELDAMISKVNVLKTLLAETKGTNILTPQQTANAKELVSSLEVAIQREQEFKREAAKPISLEMAKSMRNAGSVTELSPEIVKKYGEEIAKAANIAYNSMLSKITGANGFSLDTGKAGGLEEQLLAIKKLKPELDLIKATEEAILSTKNANASVSNQIAQVTAQQSAAIKKQVQEYEPLVSLMSKVLGIEQSQVLASYKVSGSYSEISKALSQMRDAYLKLNETQRNSDLGKELKSNIQDAERAVKRIQSQMMRPDSFNAAVNAGMDGSLEGLSERMQALRAYAQGLNLDTEEGKKELSKVNDEMEKLSEKAKELHKTTKQIKIEANSVKLGKIADMKDGDLDSVRNKIMELGTLLRNMRQDPIIDTKNLKSAEELMKKLTQQYAKLYSTSTTGKNIKSALGVDPQTLSEIREQIQRLTEIRSKLDLKKQASEIDQVTNKINELTKKQNEVVKSSKIAVEANNALTRSWNYMKNRLAFYVTVGASTQFIKSLVKIRGEYEMLERSIGILIDSAQNGSKVFAELNSMAIKSPFTTMELGAAAKQLVAYDVAAKDVVDTTRRLADMAAAVGVPIERLTYALGQIKSYNYLNARDARMFANTGIPLVRELADMYTQLEGRLVSTADVYDRIKHKAVAYEDVMKVINKMTDEGGKFFNFQEKAADTLRVKLANLELAYNNMLNEIGKSDQGVITGGLSVLKEMMQNWRSILSTIVAAGVAFGGYKAAQLLSLQLTKKMSLAEAARLTLSKRSLSLARSLKTALTSLSVNPLVLAMTALAFVLTKSIINYNELKSANEEFNKSVQDGAKENIDSIDKFFSDYKEKLDSIGGAKESEQEKMWERVRDEIEKTVKNADDYLNELNKIEKTSDRITAGTNILEHQKDIQLAVNDMARQGLFEVGGNIIDNTLSEAIKEFEDDFLGKSFVNTLGVTRRKVDEQLERFVSNMDKVNLERVIGKGGTSKEQLNDIKSYAASVRDFYLSTEDGRKISQDGLAKLNDAIDHWVSKVASARGLIKTIEVEGRVYNEKWVKRIEDNRSAWSLLFSRLREEDRKTLDYAIESGQINADEIKDIFSRAAKDMADNEKLAYSLIEDDINRLRKTPAIVIDLVYRRKENEEGDKQRTQYIDRFIKPDGEGVLSIEEYKKLYDENNKLYGSYIKKQGEDNVEWEARLGKEYRDNRDSIKRLNEQLKNRNELNSIDRDAKQGELDTLEAQQKVLEEIAKVQHFNYEKDKKGADKDILGDALSKEVQIISEMQKKYKEYLKLGVSEPEAMAKVTEEYNTSLQMVNKTLKANGFQTLTNKEIATSSAKELVSFYQEQIRVLNTLSKKTEKGAEALDKGVANLNLEATNLDYSTIISGINNQLAKLKEEYELSVSLDAQPELGGLFSSLYGIDTSDMAHSFGDVVKKAQRLVLDAFKDAGGMNLFGVSDINLEQLLDKNNFDAWVESMSKKLDSDFIKAIADVRKYLVKLRLDETNETIKNYDKLLEKYSEYEYKQRKITEDANKERQQFVNMFGNEEQKKTASNLMGKILSASDPETKQRLEEEMKALATSVAGTDAAKIQMTVSIDTHEAEETATLALEEFKKSPIWQTASTELEGMTNDALKKLRDSLKDFISTNKQLTPKQLRQVQKQINQLDKQIRKSNPFSFISSMIANAKERASVFDDAIKEMEQKITRLQSIKDPTPEQVKELERLRKELKNIKDVQKEVGSVSAQEIVSGINDAISSAQQATQMFTDMMDVLGGENGSKASENIKHISAIIDKAGQGAAMGASIGGGWGALIGGLAGGAMGVVTEFFDKWSGNKGITDAIEKSERAVKRLELTYRDLEDAVDHAYGNAAIGARKLALANKEAQLSEIKRQLLLEESRRSKNRDEDKILDLKAQIKDLELEIKNSTEEIVNDLLGVSSVGDAMESMMDAFVEALRNGEDAMATFDESIDDMIANMVKKMFTTKILTPWFEKQWATIEKKIQERGDAFLESETTEYSTVRNGQVEYWTYQQAIDRAKRLADSFKEKGNTEMYEQYMQQYENLRNRIEREYLPTTDDIKAYAELLRSGSPIMESSMEEIKRLLEELGLYKGSAKELSGLQQGIQSITESTAGAIEAYLNGVSQQVYHHSELLQQIRDAVVGIDFSENLGVMAQMLLTLQSSYQTQNAIRSIMEGWNNASGQAVRVELIS